MRGLAQIDLAVQQPVDIALVDRPAALGTYAFRHQRLGEFSCGPDRHEALENHAYRRGFGFIDDQLAVVNII
jgi:hypothetical protein